MGNDRTPVLMAIAAGLWIVLALVVRRAAWAGDQPVETLAVWG